MSRSQETFGKKEVRNKKEKKRKEKEKKRALRKTDGKKRSFDEMIAYVDEFGKISSTPPDPDKKTIVDAESIELTITKNTPQNISDPIRKGVVTFFNESKGFGFIRDSKSGEDTFVHKNNLIDPIRETDRVVFETEKGPRGLTAIRVKLDKE
jgi:cold shock CspA family protein